MASGWWQSTHTNLALGSPVDFEVTTSLQAPRGFPKLASIATGAGLFLGGTPSVVIDNVIYYAGDDYVQDTEKPVLVRYDGTADTEVVEIPYITGTTPAKAILSLCANTDGDIFISTWDSGTTSSDFAGRVFIFADGVITRIDGGLFTSGKLPYALAWFNSALYVGVTKQDPAQTGEVVKLYAEGMAIAGGPTPTCTLTGTTWTYRVGALNGTPAYGSFIDETPDTSTINRASLNSSVYNALSWSNPGGATQSYRVYSVTGSRGVIKDVPSSATTTYNDTGLDESAGAYSTPAAETMTLTVTPTPAAETYTYRIGALVDGIEFLSSAVNVTARTTLYSDLYVALSWTAHTGATSYRVYRSAGGSTQGLIATTASTSINDTGLTATGSVPSSSTTISLPSGAVACMVVYSSNLYIGSYQTTGTFGKVFKIDTSNNITTSQTAAPGGSAVAYNGYTAGIVFNSNLYMGYWNDDATDVCLIQKYNGTTWSTVSTISGAGARPWMCFAEADSMCYAYGGGDAKTGILYESSTGASWTDISALLPTSKESIPFIGTVYVLGGF